MIYDIRINIKIEWRMRNMARVAEKPLERIGGKKKLSATELKFMEVIWSPVPGETADRSPRC